MACTNFPSSGLVANVTTHQVGEILYKWTGSVWEAVSPPVDFINNLSLPYVFDTVADMVASTIAFPDGKVLQTKAYYSTISGGGSSYEVTADSSVDGYSSFTLTGGNFAHLKHDGVIKSTQFGVMPDGVTNWEADDGLRMQALYAALNKGIEIRFIRVGDNSLYFTGMNIYNYYAQNWTMSFDEGVEFGNILHIISSGSAIFDRVLTTIPTGVNPTITFAVAHGMVTQRYVDFEGTGTNLDGGSYLITPAAANTAVVTATVTGANTGTGVCSDTAIKNVTLKGTYTTYDRWGLINVDGLKADRIVCKSNPAKHTTGAEGGGVHIFTMCKNFDVGEVIIEDTKNQAASANQHAAYAQDGVGLENINVGRIWVKDTKVNGAIIAGKNCNYNTIQIDAYGRGVMSSAIPFSGSSDLHGQLSKDVAHGVWLSRLSGTINNIMVDQKDGFSGRGFAVNDVMFDRDYITWSSPSLESNVDTKEGLKVGHIHCFNPQYVGVNIGAYQQWSTPEIGKITFGIIPDDNDAILSDSNRLTRGLVNVGYGKPVIGQIKATDIKECTLLLHHSLYKVSTTPTMLHEAFVTCNSIDVDAYSARVFDVYCPHSVDSFTLGTVAIKDSYYLEPSITVRNVVKGSRIGAIYSDLPNAVNKSLLDYGAQAGQIGIIYANNHIANSTSNNAVIHLNASKYSTINSVIVDADSVAGSSAGIKYTNCYNVSVLNAKIDKMNLGVKDGGGNGRLIAIGCVSLTNTTATDLPSAALVGDVGNFQWTI